MYEELYFDSYYDKLTGWFYRKSKEYAGTIDLKYKIRDYYMIKLVQDKVSQEFSAYEQERIEEYAKNNNQYISDLHVNPRRDLCIAPKNSRLYIDNSKDKESFIEKLLIPYLYLHSFLEKEGCRPWPDYSHDYIGNFEAYKREMEPVTKEYVVQNLFYLKDIGFNIREFNKKSSSFLKLLQNESREAFIGAKKLMEDIKEFHLEKYIK